MKMPASPILTQKLGRLLAAAVLLSAPVARADDAVIYTIPATSPGANPAVVAAPRNDWVERALHNDTHAAKQAPPVRLILDGDSITDFWQTTGKEVAAKNFDRYDAVDFGISGDRTENVLWRLEHGQADGLKPKLIALMIGTNNLRRDTDEQIAEGVTAIVRAYQKKCPDAVILLQGIFPRGHEADDPFRPRIKHVNTLISKLGDDKQVIYLDFGDKFLESDGTLSKSIMPDFLHPGAKGYEIWADAIRPVIEQVFGKPAE